jgi:hypothetical protein
MLAVAGLSDASTAVALSVVSLLGVWILLNALTLFNRRDRQAIPMGGK